MPIHTELTGSERKAAVTDRLFIQEVINDLHRRGLNNNEKAMVMLRDWSRELRDKTGLRGKTKRTHAKMVGRHCW